MANTIGRLDTVFVSLINDLMALERQPLQRLTTRRDEIQVQKAIYNDLKGILDSFQRAAKGLRSSDPFYSLSDGRAVKVANVASGATVMTASAGNSAAPGTYQISNINLAKEHRIFGARQEYVNQSLNLTGSFYLGGAASQSVTASAAGAVTGMGIAAVETGQKGLGSDTYYVESRNDASSGWQFRLVNQAGESVSIKSTDGSSYTEGWQSITAGSAYDSGRGLTLTFGADSGAYTTASRSSGAASAVYTAQGALIEVTENNSLADIVSKINTASYAENNKVIASIIDNQMVLTNQRSGENYRIAANDQSGTILQSLGILNGSGAFINQQNPSNASMVVNGLLVTRYKNSGLNNVVNGLTINLAPDAQDKSATLEVTADATAARKSIDDFAQKFNKLIEYLNAKVTNIKQSDGAYKRGALAGDNIIVNLRLDLVRQMGSSVANSGTLRMLSEIGLTMDDSFKLSVSDASKLESALLSKRSDVVALLDQMSTNLETSVSRFTGASGYMATASTSLDKQLETTKQQIDTMNTRLSRREEQLYQQYGELQAQLITMTYMQQQFAATYGRYNVSS